MPRSNSVLDNFNRASIGTDWSAEPVNDGAVNLATKSSTVLAGTGNSNGWWNVDTWSDQDGGGVEVAVEIATLPPNGGSVVVQLLQQPSSSSSTADGYDAYVTINAGNDEAGLDRISNSAYTNIGSDTPDNWAAGDILILRRSTSGLTECIRDRSGTETVIASVDDDTFTGHFFAGIQINDASNTVAVDNFSAGNVAGTHPRFCSSRGGQDTGNTTSRNVTLPNGIQSGDLLLVVIGLDGTGDITWPGGGAWTEIKDMDTGGPSATLAAAYRIADGSETTVAVGSSSEGGGWIAWRVDNWHGTTPPEISTGASGDSTNPNPDSLAPSWGSADALWFAVAANDGNVAITAAPTNYLGFKNNRWANTAGAGAAYARRQLTASSDDPGTFTMATEQWAAATIAVRPVVAGGAVTPKKLAAQGVG